MTKTLGVRTRAIILSVLCTALYFFMHSQIGTFHLEGFLQILLFPVSVSILIFLGLFWVLNFNVKGERVFTISLFASVSVFIVALFFETLLINQTAVGKITTSFITVVIVFFIVYVIMLTMNILNFASINDIPLGQAGRTAAYILGLVILYLAYLLIFSYQIHVLAKLGIYFVIVFYYSYSLLWNIKTKAKRKILSSLVITLVTVLLCFVLSFWPVDTNISVLAITITLYCLLGIGMESKEKVGSHIWFEYGFLLVVIFLFILYTSSWGINGRLF
jgi:hypothetical protein